MNNGKGLSDLLPDICLDIDKQRLMEIVIEATRMTKEYMGDTIRSEEDIVSLLNKFLDTGMISTFFTIPVGCQKIPDLHFRVDPRRRMILGISKFKKKVAKLNHLLRAL